MLLVSCSRMVEVSLICEVFWSRSSAVLILAWGCGVALLSTGVVLELKALDPGMEADCAAEIPDLLLYSLSLSSYTIALFAPNIFASMIASAVLRLTRVPRRRAR